MIDLERGVVERQEHDLALRSQFHGLSDPRQPDVKPMTEFVVMDGMNTLWRWNALTGAKAKI